MKIVWKDSTLGLRNSTTRLPFRYGSATLTKCPQATLRVEIEAAGRRTAGFSGDCFPPAWFDKTPGKSFAQQIDDMLWVIAAAEREFSAALREPAPLFPAWFEASHSVHAQAAARELPALLASFGVSMVERALIDAIARAAHLSFRQTVAENLLALEPSRVHPQLAGMAPNDWLPKQPLADIFVRHTVGLGDPLTANDIPPEERLNDGYPQSLEEYIAENGLKYLKIKVANQLDSDLDRLRTIAALIEGYRGADYRVTLDGNEQYKSAAELQELVDRLQAAPELKTLLANCEVLEQPLARRIALDERHTRGIAKLSQWLPVIIDESDGEVDSFARAVELGYRGVSSKNCKGPIKSLLNAGLISKLNEQNRQDHYVMTGEDLCSVGVIPVQADLCLASAIGLEHVERNGHHYHPGLSYLPPAQQEAALAAHGDFYQRRHDRVSVRIDSGRVQVKSLQCVGFGFAVEPDFASMQSPDEWNFESLGIS